MKGRKEVQQCEGYRKGGRYSNVRDTVIWREGGRGRYSNVRGTVIWREGVRKRYSKVRGTVIWREGGRGIYGNVRSTVTKREYFHFKRDWVVIRAFPLNTTQELTQ